MSLCRTTLTQAALVVVSALIIAPLAAHPAAAEEDISIDIGQPGGGADGGTGSIDTSVGVGNEESAGSDTSGSAKPVNNTGDDGSSTPRRETCGKPQKVDVSADDPRWGGADPETHDMYVFFCTRVLIGGGGGSFPVEQVVVVPEGEDPDPPPPNPVDLAHQVWDHMKTEIPAPEPTTSPDFRTAINPELHWPVAWVNVWNWVWAEPDVWRPVTDTLSVQGVSVTVTAEPVALRLDPGDGSPVVACSNTPGVAYFPPVDNVVDPARDPNSSEIGGCGWKYLQATSRKSPSQATIFIDWDAWWTSNTGESGDLGEITTFRDTEQFVVVERRVVIAPNDSGGR